MNVFLLLLLSLKQNIFMVAETTCPVRKRTEVVSEQANQDGTGIVKTVHDLLEDDEANEHQVRLHQLHAGTIVFFWGGDIMEIT